jgi:hypothetical protein
MIFTLTVGTQPASASGNGLYFKWFNDAGSTTTITRDITRLNAIGACATGAYNVNFAWGQMVPSLQLATKGFAGASLNFQIGGPTYLITGLGRTNLKDYYNLTFDPNDSYVIGFGTKLIKNHTFNVFTVKDNRLNTGQAITHGAWRWQIADGQRLVIDVSHKTGKLTESSAVIKGNGMTVSYDFGNQFVKWAKEQKVNFSDKDQQRISAGLRF